MRDRQVSQYLYGYVFGSKYTGTRCRHKEIASIMYRLARENELSIHVGALPVPSEIHEDIAVRLAGSAYYDHMPFLLVQEPFDDTSSELVNQGFETYVSYRDLKSSLIPFVEGMLDQCCEVVDLISDSGYAVKMEPLVARSRNELASALDLLFPETFMAESGEVRIHRF